MPRWRARTSPQAKPHSPAHSLRPLQHRAGTNTPVTAAAAHASVTSGKNCDIVTCARTHAARLGDVTGQRKGMGESEALPREWETRPSRAAKGGTLSR